MAIPVSLDPVYLQEGFFPCPLTPRFKRIPATTILAISFLCVSCVVYGVEPLFETIRRTEDHSPRLMPSLTKDALENAVQGLGKLTITVKTFI